jgi:Ser/Thr protein kinase RdoA (MazF antagonist)
MIPLSLPSIVANFALDGTFLDAAPYGSGHINDTFAVRLRQSDGAARRYILQRINTTIFKEPDKLMENVVRVTEHLRRKLAAAGGNAQRRALRLFPTRAGGAYHTDQAGHVWRVYAFIEGARTFDLIASPQQAGQAGRAFGEFQKLAADLPPPRLHETLPGFHDTPQRYARFQEALARDVAGRAAGARGEIDFALGWEKRAGLLVDAQRQGRLPERITHNDTKCNNVMIDDATGAGLCVIDLDTVMPGLAVNDFGEAIRTGAATAAEDERDLSRVGLRLDLFEAYARGYLDAVRDLLTPAEIDHLVLAAQMMTYENGLRFLTDHLAGDVYYKIHHPGHNLDRCRTHWAMLREMQRRSDEMERIVRRYR